MGSFLAGLVVELARQLQCFIHCRRKGGPVFSTRDLSSPTHSCIAFQTRNSSMDLQLADSGPVENRRSTFRFDLSALNLHMVLSHFCMETQSSVRTAIKDQERTVSIDIRDAFLHVLM